MAVSYTHLDVYKRQVTFISLSYINIIKKTGLFIYVAPIASCAGFIILSGGLSENFNIVNFGAKGMFTAIFSSIASTYLYVILAKKIKIKKLYTQGADLNFNNSLSCLIPMAFIVLIFAAVNLFISKAFNVSGFQELFVNITNQLFIGMGRSLPSSLLFVFVSSFLWFFGIHGSDVLENVADSIFKPATEINQSLINAGAAPTEIYSKTYHDTFVLMGGCGSLICLLIALFLFGKRKENKYLARTSVLPMIFNINEIMVFGFPVIFNPVLFIPFILTPLVCDLTSSLAITSGLVPTAINSIEWTTPIFISGYLATDSIAGCFLQLFNVFIGVMIYLPFIKLYEKSQALQSSKMINSLTAVLKESEENSEYVTLTELENSLSYTAKLIGLDLKKALDNKSIDIYYQPQYNENNECMGAEALIRWNHARFGFLYPPLIIKIANETGILEELEEYIFKTVINNIRDFENLFGKGLLFSVNISGINLNNASFEKYLSSLYDKNKFKSRICVEISEHTALRMDEETEQKFNSFHKMGFLLAIDDFSMGKTSLRFLQSNQFDIVKLDGSIVNKINQNENSRKIIKSIMTLSDSLGFEVIAEYVENEDIRASLKEIGCLNYQGYLFSRAIPFSRLIEIYNDYINNGEDKN